MDEHLQAAAKEIVEVLEAVKSDSPDNIISIYFCEKRGSNNYRAFMPQVSNDLQKKILALILPPIFNSLKLPVVQYSPLGVLDEENEIIMSSQVNCVEIFKESVKSDNVFTDMAQLKTTKIDFYNIKISYENHEIFLFRQFTKMSKLRKGIFSQLVENELKELDSEFLGIDELTDMILMDDVLLVANHISLERVFNYRDQFQEMTSKAIGRILYEEKMVNVEQFAEDCLKDVRIMKRFTDIMSKDRLPLFFDNYDKVPAIVKDLQLDIDFDDEGKMIYRDKSQLFHIVHLMSDSYFRSLIAARVGVAEIEGKIKC